MCDTWGVPKSRAASTAGVGRPFPRARVEQSKGGADLKNALERFVRLDALSGQASQAVETNVELDIRL